MKKILLFIFFSVSLTARKIETIHLKQNIRDKSLKTKSLTLVDARTDKSLGTLTYKGETVQIKFADNDLKNYVETWFADDNKTKGNNDITVLLEEIKISNFQNTGLAKARIKISSFINRNGRYYFINRYNSTLDFNAKTTPNIPREVASAISVIFSTLINDSYAHIALSTPIPETELNNYEAVVTKNFAFIKTPELVNGVYKDFRSFSLQKPEYEYHVYKNKNGKVTGIKNREDLLVSNELFGYVDEGKMYRITPVGFLEVMKDDKGFYVISSRTELFPPQSGNGAMIGGMTGGFVGALIGAAIDSGKSGRRVDNANLSPVYIDPLTGSYIFQ